MDIKTKFSRAMKLIPDIEKIIDRDLKLQEGDLYFIGDTSWCMIQNFIDTTINTYISYKNIDLISSMSGDVKIEQIDEFMLRASNGTNSYEFAYRPFTDPVVLEKPNLTNYTDMPDIIKYGKHMFSFIDNIGSIAAQIIAGVPMMVCSQNHMLAVIAGSHELSMGLDAASGIINHAVAHDAKICAEHDKLYFYIRNNDFKVYSMMKMKKPSVPSTIINPIEKALHMSFDAPSVLTVAIKCSDYLASLPLLEKKIPKSSKNVIYEVQPDAFTVYQIDNISEKTMAKIPAEADGALHFRNALIDRRILDFLVTAAQPGDDGKLVFTIYPQLKIMVIRVTPFAESTIKDAFIVMGLTLQIG